MSRRVRMSAAMLVLGLVTVTGASAQHPGPDPRAPWDGYPTDTVKMQVSTEVLHFPEGPTSDILPIAGAMVSYVGMSGSVFIRGARQDFVDALTTRYGGETVFAKASPGQTGQTVEVEQTRRMAYAVSADQEPPGFLLDRAELGVSIGLHPLFSTKGNIGTMFVRLMARTALPSPEGAERTEMDQINVEWFPMGYESGYTNVILFPQVLVRPEEQGGEVWGRQPESPVRALRYALVFKVDVDGVAPAEQGEPADADMAVLLLAPAGTDLTLGSATTEQIFEAIRQRTGVEIHVIGDTVRPDRILSGDTPVLIAFPEADAADRASTMALRAWSVARALGAESEPLDAQALLASTQAMSEAERAEFLAKVTRELEDRARALDDLLAQLRAAAGEATEDGVS